MIQSSLFVFQSWVPFFRSSRNTGNRKGTENDVDPAAAAKPVCTKYIAVNRTPFCNKAAGENAYER